jgi:Ca2+-transporting ATPase
VIAFIVVWGINYYLSKSILHGLLHGLTIAMSVLPEEIPVAFSTFMALGAYHLYKKKVIAKSPNTVETLGAATVICVDKTGTITENQMQLAAIYDFSEDNVLDYTKGMFSFNPVLEYAMWASESNPFDSMEKSIHEAYTSTVGHDQRPLYAMSHEYPLSGQPPMMTHVFGDRNANHIIACKGGVEGIVKQSNITEVDKKKILSKTSEFASSGFRVLAVAKSDHDVNKLPSSQHDLKFIFLGLIAFYDPPKKNMEHILQQFYEAGISVKMITGDYAETALAIAGQIKLRNSAAVLTGDDVIQMNAQQLREKVNNTNIFARMFPDAKLKVIEALKANGEVVAMTGDGVNDGPALKSAHIGISMGLRGSELAKKAASLILVDDDLSHMVDAVALGRRIYENLKKAIRYIISIHIPIILIVTVPLLLFWKFTDFFSPIHVIFLELIMGPTCSIIFENEPIEADSMQKQPRKMSTAFFSFRELSLSIVQGLIITVACLGLGYYFMLQENSEAQVRSIIYATLIFSNLFLTVANRSFYYSIFTTIGYRNRLIPVVLFSSLIVLFASIYLPPIRNIFQFEKVDIVHLTLCLAVAFLGVMWIEVFKWVKRRRNRGILD